MAKNFLNNKNLVLKTFQTNQQLINHLEFNTDIDFYILRLKNRITLDRDINKNNTLHFGVTTYGNQKDKFNIETQWVFMWTIKL